MNVDQNTLLGKLEWLVDRWCERRELRPLRILLPVFHGSVTHADQLSGLLEGLQDVKGLCQSNLTTEEFNQVLSAIEKLEDLMKRRVAPPA